MMDLKNGILDVNGVIVTRETKQEDFEKLSPEIVEIEKTTSGGFYVSFLKPLTVGNVSVLVDVDYFSSSTVPQITLYPNVPEELTVDPFKECPYRLKESKKWLKAVMDVPPTNDIVDEICYDFAWGYILAYTSNDREWGMKGGEIKIVFNEAI